MTSFFARSLAVAVALVTTVAFGRTVALQAPPPAAVLDPCNIQTSERIVAIADVHGAYDNFVKILRAAGLVDAGAHWSGGRTVFVQLGDVLDRGPSSRKALDLLRQLEGEAAKAGGQVHAVLGNHEVMRMMGDYRYVSKGEYAEFQTTDSDAQRQRYYAAVTESERTKVTAAGKKFDEKAFTKQLQSETPLGLVEMAGAFTPTGEYGPWLRGHDVMVRINGIVFLHGGTSKAVAAMGCAAVNAQARTELANFKNMTVEQLLQSMIEGDSGPLWYRGLAMEDSPLNDGDVDAILKLLDARAIVVGHTVAPNAKVQWRFGRRVIQLDTGMLGGELFPGGSASALEIANGTFTVIRGGGKDTLPPPQTAAAAPAAAAAK